MLKRRSQSTDITPLVNSAVEKLQELGTAYKMARYFVCFVVNDFDYNISKILLFLGQHVKASRHGVEPADSSGVDVVIKALKDLVIYIGCCVVGLMKQINCKLQIIRCDCDTFLCPLMSNIKQHYMVDYKPASFWKERLPLPDGYMGFAPKISRQKLNKEAILI